MFTWYRNSVICYAYLSDIPEPFSVRDPNWGGLFDVKHRFKFSRWFTRGWTLQELLAPQIVEFYAANWEPFGTKEMLQHEIAVITGIGAKALLGKDLSSFNVAERMSWASQRSTTRIEDRAYSLLGIFQVNMPLLYGEGNRAFLRLQEEILKTVDDYTIFAWPGAKCGDLMLKKLESYSEDNVSIFASDPAQFRLMGDGAWRYSDLIRISDYDMGRVEETESVEAQQNNEEWYFGPPTITGRGVSICFPIRKYGARACLASTYYSLKERANVFVFSWRTAFWSQINLSVYTQRGCTSFLLHPSLSAAGYTWTDYIQTLRPPGWISTRH